MAKRDDKTDVDAAPDSELADIRELFAECEEAESEQRIRELDDIKFARLGSEYQWPEKIRVQRELDGRPCLTTNFLNPLIRQVVNDCRQNKPAIKFHPADDVADPETAEIFNGLVRNIEACSDADVAYDTAVDSAVSGGRGYFRINTEYSTDDTFDQDICIRRISNPLSVFGDPWSEAADSSDWNVAFVIDSMSERAFKRKWKGADPSSFDSDAYRRVGAPWGDGKSVQVAEYWSREETKRQIVAVSIGPVPADVPGELRMAMEAAGIAEGTVQVVDLKVYEQNKALFDAVGSEVLGEPRSVASHKVVQKIVTGCEVLETVQWAGKFIPIVPVYGDEVNVDGKRIFRSLIADAKDPQRRFNFWDSAATEMVALAPKAPFIGEEGAFVGVDASKWDSANTQSYAFLSYPKGTLPPQRQFPASMPAAELQMSLRAHDDIKATTGLYDASLGARSNETSGKAILARERQGDVSTFHFIDNLSRAIRHAGRIVGDLIPHVYSAERVIRVLGPDGTPRTVPLKQKTPVMGPDGQPKQEQGPDGRMIAIERIFDLSVGKYDLTVSAGPSFSTKREESAAQMIELIRAYPAAAPLIGDLLAKNLDWPGADEIAARLKAMLPPQINGGNPEAEAAQQQLKELQGVLMAMKQKLDATEASKAAEVARAQGDAANQARQLENDAEKLKIDKFNAETNRMKALEPKGVGLPAGSEGAVVALIMQTIAQLLDGPDLGGDEGGQALPMIDIPPEDFGPTGGFAEPEPEDIPEQPEPEPVFQ